MIKTLIFFFTITAIIFIVCFTVYFSQINKINYKKAEIEYKFIPDEDEEAYCNRTYPCEQCGNYRRIF